MKAVGIAGPLAAACFLLVILPGNSLGEFGRVIPVPAGGYSQIAPVKPGDGQPRPKGGEAIRVPTYSVAEAGQFDVDAGVVTASFATTRGFEAVYIGVSSADIKRGARVAVYSFPAKKLVTLLADVNTLIEGAAGNERLSQTTISGDFCQVGQKVYFATGQAKPKAEFAGGHLIAFDIAFKTFADLGIIAPGGAVRSLVQQDRTHLLAAVEMAGSNETRLYRIDLGGIPETRRRRGSVYEAPPQSQPAPKITFQDTQVRDVVDLWPAGQNAWYITGRQTPLRHWNMDEDPAPVAVGSGSSGQDAATIGPAYWIGGFDRGYFPGKPVLLQCDEGPFALAAAPKELADLLPSTRPECVAWIRARHWIGEAYGDSPQRKGVLYMARSGEEGAADLAVCALAEKGSRHYPIVDAASGKAMQTPLGMAINTFNDLLVVGVVNGELRAAAIDDVFLDEVVALDDQIAQKLVAADGRPIIKVTSYSLTGLDPVQDRPYDALQVASDGTVYGGTMPHHPTGGTVIVRFDPRKQVLENLGYIDVLAGETQPTDVPSMMHSAPVQAGRFMVFTGQDPFYGQGWRFPELPAGAAYPGTHVITFDLKTHVIRDVGIPVEGYSMFWNAGHANSELLYLRAHYSQGPLYRVNLATGKVDDLKVNCPSHIMLVGADGNLFFGEHTRADAKANLKARDVLVSFDPNTHQKEVVKEDWSLDWIKGQDGQVEALCCDEDEMYAFNTQTHALRKLMKFTKQNSLGGDLASRNGVICQAFVTRPKGIRLTNLLTARLEDEAFKDHGFLMDQKGRIASEINAVAAGDDDTIYAIGQFWPKPGDPVAMRERPPYRDLGDNCFIVIKGIKP